MEEKVLYLAMKPYRWIIWAGIICLLLAIVSPLIMIWASFMLFIKILVSCLFLMVVFAAIHTFIKYAMKEAIKNKLADLKPKQTFKDKMAKMMAQAEKEQEERKNKTL